MKTKTQNIYETILFRGLWSSVDPDEFSWKPCACCGGLAGQREKIKGFLSLEDSKDEGNSYEFSVCPSCIYVSQYGEE